MKKIYVLASLFLMISVAHAQEQAKQTTTSEVAHDQIIKMNLTSLLFGNLYFQYEYVHTAHSSFALGVSWLPSRGPWGSSDDMEDLSFSGYSITPEYRYHFSGKGAKGFYMAPYFRHAGYSTNSFQYTFEKDNGTRDTINLQNASFTANNVGLMFGSQWKLSNRVSLDFWIVGVGFGSSTIELEGTGDFSQSDRDDFDENIADISVPGGEVEGTMTSNTVNISYTNHIAFRGLGLAIGYIF
jgi:hypothetical protein